MIGRMHNRIVFKLKVSTPDGAGGFVNLLGDYYTCWAEIYKQSNDRSDIAGKDNLSDDITFKIRYTISKEFTNSLIISYNDKLYNINSIVNQYDENRFFLIGCSTLK